MKFSSNFKLIPRREKYLNFRGKNGLMKLSYQGSSDPWKLK